MSPSAFQSILLIPIIKRNNVTIFILLTLCRLHKAVKRLQSQRSSFYPIQAADLCSHYSGIHSLHSSADPY